MKGARGGLDSAVDINRMKQEQAVAGNQLTQLWIILA